MAFAGAAFAAALARAAYGLGLGALGKRLPGPGPGGIASGLVDAERRPPVLASSQNGATIAVEGRSREGTLAAAWPNEIASAKAGGARRGRIQNLP